MKPDLLVAPCDYKAAKFAVEHWHYSGCMPVGKLVKFGAWEQGEFIGAVVYAQGNNQYQGKSFGLSMQQITELTRVALRTHSSTVSKIVAITVNQLRKYNNNLRCLFSYADPIHGHVGSIYQAMNWVFVGMGGSNEAFVDRHGRRIHSRNISPRGIKENFGTYSRCLTPEDVTRVKLPLKYKYLYPLDRAMRRQIEPLRQPYPKREDARAIDGNTFSDQLEDGGSTPTRPLEELTHG
jgi:hypothetical protein